MADPRPNVLLILQDQLRHDLVVGDRCPTPTFDRLRAEGTWFDRFYTPLGICSPARASMFTGLYPHTHGMLNNIGGTDAIVRNLSRSFPTVAELLGKAGYRTGYVGKWHLGFDDTPADRGFADWRGRDRDLMKGAYEEYWQQFKAGVPGAVTTRYRPGSDRFSERFERTPFPIFTSVVQESEDVIPARAVLDRSAELVDEYTSGGDPWFLVASFIEPHWPNALPEPWASMFDPETIEPWPNFADDYEGKPRANHSMLEHFGVEGWTWDDWAPIVAKYLGAVAFLDDLTGRLVSRLDESGARDDTLLIVSCDHGDLCGAHRQFNKGPVMWEEVYHIPAVMRWPGGGVRAGLSTDGFAGHNDLLPTICEAAGIPVPDPCHGTSLLSQARGGQHGRDAIYSEFHGDEFGLCSQRMIRRGDWKLVYNPNDVRELYDLADDPWEMRNLADEPEHRATRLDLEAHLLELMYDNDDSLRLWARNVLG